jgi:hypothetical protein
VTDFHDLTLNAITEKIVLPYGGHNGFLMGLLKGCWYEGAMARRFGAIAAGRS